jgi:hypothetical protein
VKLKWKTKGVAETNGGYTHESLLRLLGKYGPVDVAMGSKEGRAIASFSTAEDAECAVQFERGMPANPLIECR